MIQVFDGDGIDRDEEGFFHFLARNTYTKLPAREFRGDIVERAATLPEVARKDTEITLKVHMSDLGKELKDVTGTLIEHRFALIESLTLHSFFGFHDIIFDDLIFLEASMPMVTPSNAHNYSHIRVLARWRRLRAVETY